MLDILLLVVLVVYIFSKLLGVLGDTKYDNGLSEDAKKAFENFKKYAGVKPGKIVDAEVVDVEAENEQQISGDVAHVFQELNRKDPTITITNFLAGAKRAYESILKSYATGNVKALQQLLSDELYKEFEKQVNALKDKVQILDLTIVSIGQPEIIEAYKEGHEVFVVVKFESEQIRYIKDAISLTIISGNQSKIVKSIDTWTFVKDLKEISNIWKLSSTEDEK